MAIVPVILGSAPNDGRGDKARTAFEKINSNTADLNSRLVELTAAVESLTVEHNNVDGGQF